MYGEKLTAYKFTPDELQQTLIDFFIKKYDYEPLIEVSFVGTIWLPVRLRIEPENTEEFARFYQNLLRDIINIKNKHGGGEFEVGDKVIQLFFQKETTQYILEHFYHGSEVELFDEEGYIVILMKETPPKPSTKSAREKLSEFHEEWFSMKEIMDETF